jgi:hypothetical protein
MEGIRPGTNRRSHHKTLRKLWRWAHDLGHVGNDPMAKLKPLDEWGVNNEVLSHALFQRFLRVVQGLESPRDRLERTQKYKGLLPYLVLGGLFRSSGDVARAMGDAESTVKRFYVRTLEPGASKEWFDLSAKGSPSNSFDASTTAKNSNNVSDCRRERGPCSRASNCLARKVRIFCVLRPGWPSRLVPPAFFRRCSRLLAFGRASMRSY